MYKYNEKKYVEHIFKNGFSGKHINNEIRLLAIHYKEQGYNETERENLLYEFCEKNLEAFDRVEYFKKINAALNNANKNEARLIEVSKINVNQTELNYIDQLNLSHDYKKIIFTLLILDKLNKEVQKQRDPEKLNDEHFFGGTNKNYKELIDASTVHMKSKKIHSIIREFAELGIVEIRGRGYIKLSFIYSLHNQKNKLLTISSYDDIGHYYDFIHCKNRIIECNMCKSLIKATSNTKKYCDQCAKDREKARKRNWKQTNKQ
ncbi:hypothetical protein NQZ71_13240 [Niallia taxi]|uniref:hypothetical protein n=1 Tax=Niallia taxi TaxID=2499688 RepID=UPI002934DA1B|nr:hypothetical protein [Niallia taxi]WOD61780.1 hypothetical protein NQZ71_13240 [Niallia taxi]